MLIEFLKIEGISENKNVYFIKFTTSRHCEQYCGWINNSDVYRRAWGFLSRAKRIACSISAAAGPKRRSRSGLGGPGRQADDDNRQLSRLDRLGNVHVKT